MEQIAKEIKQFTVDHHLQLFIYNLIVMFFVLIHSLGYFDPFFTISANVVIILSIILAIFMLHLRSKGVFILSLGLWTVSALFQVLKINIWAERVGMYTYETILLGVCVFFYEINSLRVTNYLKNVKIKLN